MKLPYAELKIARPLRESLPVKTALVVIGTPLFLLLLVAATTTIYLVRESRQIGFTEATVASRWIADRLATVPQEEWLPALRRAHKEIEGGIGLYDASGQRLFGAGLDEVFKHLSGRPSALPEEKTLRGKKYAVSSSNLSSSDQAYSLFVALPVRNIQQSMWGAAARRLGIAAIVLSLLAIAFGYQSGAGLSDVLQRLRKRVHTMISTNDPHVPVENSRNYGNGELAELLRAINGLEERFASELVLYKDALEEVRAFGAQRTSYLKAIAGELRTPLNSIIIESQKLAEDPTSKLSQTQLEDLRIIQKAGRRLLTGVDEILDLSALMSGNLQFDKDRIDISELAAEVTETAKGELGQRDIKIIFEKRMAGEIAVHGNRQRLWQVLTNLVGNAIKFTEHGQIRVIVGKTGDGKVTIEVIDTGVGIPPGDQQAIFDPFSQSGKRSKRRRGTGLGLAIVQRLVKLHGGSIYVSSREGQGSHFTVTLP